MKSYSLAFARGTVAALVVFGSAAAIAQSASTAPAKPPAKAPAKAATQDVIKTGNTTSVLKPGEKPMSREELRSCLKRNDDLVAATKSLDERQVASQQARVVLEQEGTQLKAERDALQAEAVQLTDAFRAKVEALNARVKRYSDRAQALADSRNPSRSEQEKLEAERTAIQAETTVLNGERDSIARTVEERNKAFNQRATDRDNRVNDWNGRNMKIVEEVRATELLSDAWRRECGNRPYREDDEKAIREGK